MFQLQITVGRRGTFPQSGLDSIDTLRLQLRSSAGRLGRVWSAGSIVHQGVDEIVVVVVVGCIDIHIHVVGIFVDLPVPHTAGTRSWGAGRQGRRRWTRWRPTAVRR